VPQSVVSIAEPLVEWFRGHARDVPWRRERTPYRAWVAEVMLQQTRASTVVSYFERFLEVFPTVQVLASASLEDVLRVWEGLGYYARARNLHAAAQIVVKEHGGQLPQTFDGLVLLPGIGSYIAGALASIVFGEDVLAVDGNAGRVLCRVLRFEKDISRPAVRRELEGLASNLLPTGQAGEFNEALMELGALICTPIAPQCDLCPLEGACLARAADCPEDLPVRIPRRGIPHYDVAAAVTLAPDGQVLVAQRKADDMLGGLWEFPGGKQEPGETLTQCLAREMQEELDITVEVGARLVTVRHAYTHFRITLHAFICRILTGQPRCLDCAAFRWVPVAGLDALPMSVADRKIARVFQAVAE